MSFTSFSFKDSLTVDNNKFVRWLDTSGVSRASIIGVDPSNAVNLNTFDNNDLFVNKGPNASTTFVNISNGSSVIVGSKLGIGMVSTSNVTADLTIVKNGVIGVNTSSINDGNLTISGAGGASNTLGSRMVLYGNNSTGAGGLRMYSGNTVGSGINLYTGNDSLKYQINELKSTRKRPE